MSIITLDVETDYPHRFTEGEALYDKDGFIIGHIRLVTENI